MIGVILSLLEKMVSFVFLFPCTDSMGICDPFAGIILVDEMLRLAVPTLVHSSIPGVSTIS